MTDAHVVILPGDGIGPEVLESAILVLQKAAQMGSIDLRLEHGWIGGSALDLCGEPIFPETLQACKEAHAVLLGAVGGPKWENNPGHLRPEAGLLQLRKEMGVYANLRPVVARPALAPFTPYRPEILQGVDLLMVRELTGGIYFGEKGRDPDSAFDVCRYHRHEIERIARVAGRLAQQRRKKLCSIDKANVMETSRLWRQVVTEVMEREFPDVQLEHVLVDAAAMYLTLKPAQFDVLLTENMFGDILSDQASTLAGSLGLLPSASLGEQLGLYEPIHGSAPDIAGRGIANPIGTILSVAMMLRLSLHQPDLADAVERAVEKVLATGPLTPDLERYHPSHTRELTTRVCSALGAE
ncbi:3-isopropylmalate dehydrogenase [Oligoflexus tunisiensis]|uniref:3-isopropylmalate dehydrogenase n=1 Tax=Oligoflexus tunisiensis TaxID=708132 RepID=UPI000A4560C5|nr:3-isopropylmalate dehydrogenase [Oligoflexus tunisiensis]